MLILVAVSVRILIDSDLIGTAEKTANLFQKEADEETNLSTSSIEIGEDGTTLADYIARALLTTETNCDHNDVEVDGEIVCTECERVWVDFATTYGTIEVVWLDTNNNIIDEPLEPNLGDGMTKVAWNGTTEYTPSSNSEWYNYEEGTGTEDNTSSLWANAKTEDGSYWVWIPRFAYRITYYNGTDIGTSQVSGYSDGRGIVDIDGRVQDELETGIKIVYDYDADNNIITYIVHPAFETDVSSGGWDNDLSGFWVAKFEMSMETNEVTTTTSSSSIGNVTTSDTIKAVSKANVTSWRYISVGNAYTNAYNYNRELESHLIKNSEWGAVAYLTHSQYGRNGTEITRNVSNFLTGGGAYTTNVSQSSTGNIYGIYDLAGGAQDVVAVWDTLSTSADITTSASSFASTGGSSTKYATAYSNGTSRYSYYDVGIYDVGITGDATKEVWKGVSGTTASWFVDYSMMVYSSVPFLGRGGNVYDGSSGGLFSSDVEGQFTGSGMDNGFRVILSF